jgi:ketosteroid isomerase-like protein
MRSFLIALTLSALALPVLSQRAADEAAIRGLRAASNQAITNGNADAFASSLAPDLVVVTGNGTFLTRDAYVGAFSNDFKDPHSVRFERVTDSIDLSQALPLAAEHGHWIGRVMGGPVLFHGTYLAMWRKSSAGWQLRSELFVVLGCKDDQACEAYRHRYTESK